MLKLDFFPPSDEGNAVIYPTEDSDSIYFTLIGAGSDEDQSNLLTLIVAAVNGHDQMQARIAELTAALREMLDSYEGDMKFCGYSQDAFDNADAVKQARAALNGGNKP